MNAMRWGLFCALVGWMATAAEAQWGTYGSPDPIPFGQSVPPNPYLPAAASRTAYLTGVDDPGAALRLPPSGNIPQPPSESAATMMMLNEPAPTVVPRGNVPPAADAINDAGRGDACGSVCFGNCCDSRWYASFEALYMTRNQPSEFCTSIYAPADGSLPVNRGGFNGMDWIWGGQATLGYRFGCCCDWALEATYWGLAESCTDGTPNNIPSCPYVSTMNLSMVSILGTTGGAVTPTNPNGYQTADYYTNNSPDNHIWRNWNVQNVELNFVRPLCCGGCNRFGVDFLAGVRWLHFQDGFLFGAERVDDGSPYAGDWLFMDDHITNDLVGFQAGFNANYCFADCWKVFFRPVVGVFNNYVSLDYNLYAVSCTTGAVPGFVADLHQPELSDSRQHRRILLPDPGRSGPGLADLPARLGRVGLSRGGHDGNGVVGQPVSERRQRDAVHRRNQAQRRLAPARRLYWCDVHVVRTCFEDSQDFAEKRSTTAS